MSTIYIVYGKMEDDDSNFIEIIEAFPNREEASNFCGELLSKEDNPYEEVLWQSTNLRG